MIRQPINQWARAAIFIAAAAAIVLRIWGLDRFALDGDEIFSLQAASESWAGLFSVSIRDISHPPLFYILLKIWMAIGGDSDAWIRLLPALLGIGALVPTYLICRELQLRETETALVLALLAVNGFLIEYSQHLRMFSLLQVMSVTSIWLMLKFAGSESGNTRSVFFLTLANLALVYSHYWGSLVIAAEGAVLLFVARRRLPKFLLSTAIVVLGFVPWLFLIAQAAVEKGSAIKQLSWISKPGLLDVVWLFVTLNGPYDFPRSSTTGLVLFAVPVAIWAWQALHEKNHGHTLLVTLALLAGVPVALTLAASYASGQSVWGGRHLIIVAVPYLILVVSAAYRLQWRWAAKTIPGAMLLWAMGSGIESYMDENKKLAWDVLVQRIRAESSAGGEVISIFTLEPFVANPLVFHSSRRSGIPFDVKVEKELERVEGERFWVVYRNFKWDRAAAPEDILSEHNFTVGDGLSISMGSMRIIALPVRKISS